jgi:hypothetical protein
MLSLAPAGAVLLAAVLLAAVLSAALLLAAGCCAVGSGSGSGSGEMTNWTKRASFGATTLIRMPDWCWSRQLLLLL